MNNRTKGDAGKCFTLLLIGLSSSLAWGSTEWHTARVTELEILETYPVRYRLTYEAKCADLEIKPIRVRTKNELVVGLAAKRDTSAACIDEIQLKKITLQGGKKDPNSVQILK